MLAHSFDRFYVVTKFILPTVNDLKLSPMKYDKECKYLYNLDDKDSKQIKENIRELLSYCAKLRPYMPFINCKLMLVIKLHIIY